MRASLFYRLGKVIYQSRWSFIGIWLIVILSCLPFIPNLITPFKTTGFIVKNSPSALTDHFLKNFGYANKIIIIYSDNKLSTTNPLFMKKIKQSVAKLKDFPIKNEIFLPNNKQQISQDKHSAYVVVVFKTNKPLNDKSLALFKSLLNKPSNMTMQLGGEPIFVESVNKQTQIDLYRADIIAAPLTIITLMIVFGSLTAALLPIILGGGCALIILTLLYFLGQVVTLSIFTLNIALLLGLCLSLDYSLFIITRFRDELENGHNITEALAITEATAGKAVLFSGLAVFASLSALLLFPVNILFSVAIGGLAAVVIAVLNAILLLPAILALLKNNINFLPIKLFKSRKYEGNFWRSLAKKIVRYPFPFFLTVVIFLMALGYPLFNVKLGVSDFHIFPSHSQARHFFDSYSKNFDEENLSPIFLLVQTKDGNILDRKNLKNVAEITHYLRHNPRVNRVESIVTLEPALTIKQYYALYHLPANRVDKKIKQLLSTSTGKNFTLITIISKYPAESAETAQLIEELRHIHVPKALSLHLTGLPVNNDELTASIIHILPYAFLWIVGFTYIILLLLLRSLFLPFKAILMNILSLSACYGALVLVFQEGHLHQLLQFEPQGMLDVSLLVIIFCALFGFSMDYEVFLLSRIKDAYELSANNKKSIIYGIEKSSRIITSAAIIVIFICGAFLVAEVVMVKAFGLGIAVAIFVDAFLIRTLLVPSTMTLLKSWNWYLPKCLDKILPRL